MGLQYRAKKKRKGLRSAIAASVPSDDKEETIKGQVSVGPSSARTAVICKLDLTKEQLDFETNETEGKRPRDLEKNQTGEGNEASPAEIVPRKDAPSSSFFIGGLDETEEIGEKTKESEGSGEEMAENEIKSKFVAEKKRPKTKSKPKIVDEK